MALILGLATLARAQLTNGVGYVNGYHIAPGVNLTGADLYGANLGAQLMGVSSGRLSGSPGVLPPSWSVWNGYLIGLGANLTGANLTNAVIAYGSLIGVKLTGANLAGVNFQSAYLISISDTNAWEGTIAGVL